LIGSHFMTPSVAMTCLRRRLLMLKNRVLDSRFHGNDSYEMGYSRLAEQIKFCATRSKGIE